MAKFNIETANHYGGQGGAGYFSLKDDGQTAKVAFLLNGIEDLEGYTVHQVEVDGKKRYVNCLHEYGNPKDDCPFCAAGKFTMAKYFIPLYNFNENKVQSWERGKKFGDRISAFCARHPNTVTWGVEIQRIGKPKDTQTTYDMYEAREFDDPNRKVEDFDFKDPLGSIILDKSADEMEYYLQAGTFPSEDNYGTGPVRGERDSRQTSERQSYEERPMRRPSASTDRF